LAICWRQGGYFGEDLKGIKLNKEQTKIKTLGNKKGPTGPRNKKWAKGPFIALWIYNAKQRDKNPKRRALPCARSINTTPLILLRKIGSGGRI
jgi:hypothetical protein